MGSGAGICGSRSLRSTWPLAIVLAAILATFLASTASAKMPYFSVELSPDAPVADQPILVVVRLWEDADHTVLAPYRMGDVLDDLLVVRPAAGRGPDIPVTLRLGDANRYEGSVTLPAGDWSLVAFPDRTGWGTAGVPVGYPDTIPLNVRAAPSEQSAFVSPFVAAAAALLAVTLVAIALRVPPLGRISRRPASTRPSTGP